ncbi:MAG: hypothetical protein QOJ40_74 [Verrucomicrobiota bacterium]
MTKKDILFLLVPSLLFIALAVASLHWSGGLFSNDRFEEWRQRNFDELTGKLQSGELQLAPDQIVKLLRDARHVEQAQREFLAVNGRIMRALGWFGLVGVVSQIYVVARVKAGCKKGDG